MKKLMTILMMTAGCALAVETNITVGGTGALPSYTQESGILSATVDFSQWNVVSNDILNVLNVPAGHLVESVYASVVSTSACSGAYTIKVGDGAGSGGFISSLNLSTVNSTWSTPASTAVATPTFSLTTNVMTNVIWNAGAATNDFSVVVGGSLTISTAVTTTGYKGGKLYTSSDTIDITANDTITTGKVKVSAIITKM